MKKLMIIGAGDIAQRCLPLLKNWLVVLTHRTQLDLDKVTSNEELLSCLPKSDAVLYTVPPWNHGETDVRLKVILDFWQQYPELIPYHIVYISTSGVYGDCNGAWVDEECKPHPNSDRAIRRLNAEQQLQKFACNYHIGVTILRAPGIYAAERLPLQRIHDGLPVLHETEDVYSNHIHADDLAMICVAGLNQTEFRNTRVLNASDDVPLKMGVWFSELAKAHGLPIPPRCSRSELMRQVSEIRWSFMCESRRLRNDKIKESLGVTLRYPSILDYLKTL